MQKITLVLVVGALSLAGWQAWDACSLREDLAAQDAEAVALRADVHRLAKEIALLRGMEAPPPLARLEGATPPPAVSSEPTLLPRGASPEVLARAVRDLQAEVADLREQDERIDEKLAATPSRTWKRPTMIHDVASAERALDLSAGQRADIERIVEYTKRELEDVRSIPNDEGKTWADVSKVKMTEGEGFSFALPDMAAIQTFKRGKIPGSNETYGEAEKRIRARGNREVRDVLTPEQTKTWDGAHTDGLFGSGTSGSVISFASVVTESD